MDAKVIFCDDVRVERNGKLILIGAYPVDLLSSRYPNVVSVRAVVVFSGDIDEGAEFDLKFILQPGDLQIALAHVEVGSIVRYDSEKYTTHIFPVVFEIQRDGSLELIVERKGCTPVKIGNLFLAKVAEDT